MRIGELVRELDTAERERDEEGRLRPSAGTQDTKRKAIAAAGLSKSEAYPARLRDGSAKPSR